MLEFYARILNGERPSRVSCPYTGPSFEGTIRIPGFEWFSGMEICTRKKVNEL